MDEGRQAVWMPVGAPALECHVPPEGIAVLGKPAEERHLDLSEAMFDVLAAGILAAAPATYDASVTTVAVTFLTVLAELPALTDAERTLMAEWVTRSLARLRQG